MFVKNRIFAVTLCAVLSASVVWAESVPTSGAAGSAALFAPTPVPETAPAVPPASAASPSPSSAQTTPSPSASPATPAVAAPAPTAGVAPAAGPAPSTAPVAGVAPAPVLTEEERAVIQAAEQAALAAFRMDYQNHSQQMTRLSRLFTPEAWMAFQKAMADSKNLEAIQSEKMTVTPKLNGESKILHQETAASPKVWQIRVPVQVDYKGDRRSVQQNLLIDISLVPAPKSAMADAPAFSVTQFIAKTQDLAAAKPRIIAA